MVGSYGVGMTTVSTRMPVAGETISGGTFSLGPGGKGSNQAIGVARLGAEVELLTALGPDSFAAQAREVWDAEGVTHRHVLTGTRPTMVATILVDGDGENRIIIAPGALQELRPAHVEAFADRLRAADLVLVSLEIPVDTAVTALRLAQAAGTPTLLNPAPAAPLPDEAWPAIGCLTPNLSEARTLAGVPGDDPDVLADALRARFSGALVLTLGADGAFADDGTRRWRVPPVPATIVDTTGAGDAFTAALGYALAAGAPLDAAIRYATAAGAHAVTHPEVIPGLPYPADLPPL